MPSMIINTLRVVGRRDNRANLGSSRIWFNRPGSEQYRFLHIPATPLISELDPSESSFRAQNHAPRLRSTMLLLVNPRQAKHHHSHSLIPPLWWDERENPNGKGEKTCGLRFRHFNMETKQPTKKRRNKWCKSNPSSQADWCPSRPWAMATPGKLPPSFIAAYDIVWYGISILVQVSYCSCAPSEPLVHSQPTCWGFRVTNRECLDSTQAVSKHQCVIKTSHESKT